MYTIMEARGSFRILDESGAIAAIFYDLDEAQEICAALNARRS